MTKFPTIAAVFLFGLVALWDGRAAAGESPTAVAGGFQDMLIEVMKTAENTTVKQRCQSLEPGVEKSFHIVLMIQIATGKYWKEATREEQADLTNAFKRMSISTLATLFDDYNGEVFRQVGIKDGPSGTKLVMMELVKSDKSTVDIAYLKLENLGSGGRL